MKAEFLILIILCCLACNVFAYDNSEYSWQNSKTYSTNSDVSKIGDNYYMYDSKTQSYTRYSRQGNDIYGSDGSHYKQSGNMINDTAPHSNSYIINNNLIQPLY